MWEGKVMKRAHITLIWYKKNIKKLQKKSHTGGGGVRVKGKDRAQPGYIVGIQTYIFEGLGPLSHLSRRYSREKFKLVYGRGMGGRPGAKGPRGRGRVQVV